MPCYHPLRAYTQAEGGVTFKSPTTHDGNPIDLPCGQCYGCRLQRSRDWAVRIMHEAQLHEENCFVTLTYSDANQPSSLQYRDFQLFLKRLRKHHSLSHSQSNKLRFYMVGEYGSNSKRAHFHACLFNISFPDQIYFKKTESGERIYTSETLSKLWPWGHCSIGQLTFQSAAYCARYIMAKITGDAAERHYDGRKPEFNCMSRRPGIGAGWLDKFRSDVFPCDYVVSSDGHKDRVPKYYDKLNKRHDALEIDQIKSERAANALPGRADNTPSRLAVKEAVHIAAIKQLHRTL